MGRAQMQLCARLYFIRHGGRQVSDGPRRSKALCETILYAVC